MEIISIVAATLVLFLASFAFMYWLNKQYFTKETTNTTGTVGDQIHNHYNTYNQVPSKPNLFPDLDFFKAYANIPGPRKLRTTTVTQIMAQAAKIEKPSKQQIALRETLGAGQGNKTARTVNTAIRVADTEPSARSGEGVEGNVQKGNKELNDKETDYEKHLKDKYGIVLYRACPCPGGTGHCPWDMELMSEIINDNSCWNLISIQIRTMDGILLATTTIDQQTTSPSGTYTVSSLLTLEPLSVGDQVFLVVHWINDNLQNQVTSLPIEIVAPGNEGQSIIANTKTPKVL